MAEVELPDPEELEELEFDADFEGDELFDIENIEDMQAFMEQNPTLVDSSQLLMGSLSRADVE